MCCDPSAKVVKSLFDYRLDSRGFLACRHVSHYSHALAKTIRYKNGLTAASLNVCDFKWLKRGVILHLVCDPSAIKARCWGRVRSYRQLASRFKEVHGTAVYHIFRLMKFDGTTLVVVKLSVRKEDGAEIPYPH